MDTLIADIIFLVHIIIILFVIIVPFINSPYLLFLHSVFIPFLIAHWLLNNNTCMLTTVEKYFKGIKNKEDEQDCFTCKLIDPMFNFTKDYKKFSKMTYIVTILLWIISTSRLSLKFYHKEIKNIYDLLKI